MSPPLFVLIPGLAFFVIIQIILCRAYHCHVSLARTKRRAKPDEVSSKSHQTEPPRPRGMLGPRCNEVEHSKSEASQPAVPYGRAGEGPKGDKGTKTRRKSVFAESYDPSIDDSAEKIVNPKTPEEKKWLIQNLRNITLFQHLANDQVTTVVDAMHKQEVQEGEVVMRQGDKGNTFYMIQTGVYKVYKCYEGEVKGKLVHTYNNEGSFGELALLYNQPRAATVVARTEGVLWAVDGTTFRRIVNRITYQKRMMYESLINNVPALKALEPYERANLVDALVPINFEHGQQIIKQGDEAKGMYFIISGGVRIVVKTPQGKEILLKELSNSEYFGELALVTKSPRAASVFAVGPTYLAFLEREAFERLLGPCMDVMRRQIDDYTSLLANVMKNRNI